MISVSLDPDREFVITLPYNLTLDKVRLDPNSKNATLYDTLEWLTDNATEDEMSRIMRSAIILQKIIVPTPPIAACLDTAITWERG